MGRKCWLQAWGAVFPAGRNSRSRSGGLLSPLQAVFGSTISLSRDPFPRFSAMPLAATSQRIGRPLFPKKTFSPLNTNGKRPFSNGFSSPSPGSSSPTGTPRVARQNSSPKPINTGRKWRRSYRAASNLAQPAAGGEQVESRKWIVDFVVIGRCPFFVHAAQ